MQSLLLVVLAISLAFTTSIAFASTNGLMKEVIVNEEMQVYVLGFEEVPPTDIMQFPGRKQIDVQLIIKNSEPSPRVFNLFFARMIDNAGEEYRANPLLSTILPIRIAPNDTLSGRLTFIIPSDASPSLLVWQEPDASKITVDLSKAKDPADPILQSDWILTSNKGKTFADGRSELIIHEELMSISPKVYLVEISIRNMSDKIIKYSPAYAFVKDDVGRLYPIDLQNIGALKNPLREGQLKPGESVRGTLLFVLPDDVEKVMLIYDEEIGLGSYFVAPEFPFAILALLLSIFVIVSMRLYAKGALLQRLRL
jgi:hypothetical protein